MSSIVIAGDTSGTITLSAPAVAGSNTISLPAVTGTILTTAYTGAVTFDGDFTVDTDTLHVDSTNNRVGIGKTNPTTALDVVGTVTATAFAGALTGNVTGDVSGNAGTVTNGVYTTDIGSTVQAYDADTAKLDTAQTWTATQSYGDNVKQQFGASNDLQIYHSGTASYVSDTGAGNLILQGTNVQLRNAGDTANYLVGVDGGATSIQYNGNTKLATSNTGVDVTGTLTATDVTIGGSSVVVDTDIGSTVQAYDADTAKLDTAQTWTATQTYGDNVKQQFGASNDLEIYHNGTASYINDTGTGNLIIGSASSLVVQDPTFTTTSAVLTPTGSAKFTYNGATKLETSNTGVTVTGTVAATAFTGDGSGLTGISAGGFSNVQTFTSPGTWTNPGSVTKVKVTVVGGGGGGSGSNQPNPAVNRSGAGGGGGGTAIEWISIPTSPVPVTIGGGGSAGSPTGDGGNGGTSSFGAYCSATGGTGGDCQPSSPGYPTYVFGGIGGAGSGGNLNLPGQTLGWHPVGGAQGQSGGQSMLGTGGMGGQNSPRGTKGDDGNNYGGGGGGYGGPGGSFTGGGAGASGVVVVEW